MSETELLNLIHQLFPVSQEKAAIYSTTLSDPSPCLTFSFPSYFIHVSYRALENDFTASFRSRPNSNGVAPPTMFLTSVHDLAGYLSWVNENVLL